MDGLGLWAGLILRLEPDPFNNRVLKKSSINNLAKKLGLNMQFLQVEFVGSDGSMYRSNNNVHV